MHHSILYLTIAFIMGVAMSIYLPMNSTVSRVVGSSIMANIAFFAVALLTTIVIFIVSNRSDMLLKMRNVPAYLYTSGMISAFILFGTTFLIPQIGARKFFILLVAGQVVMAILVSHLGIFESPKDPVSMKKLAGAVLVMTGAAVSVY